MSWDHDFRVPEDLRDLDIQDRPLAEVLQVVQMVYVSPQNHYRRIIETVHLRDSSVVRVVTMEVRLPPGRRVYLPILNPRKGVLVDNLTIEEAPGVAPWTLNRREAKVLTSGLVQHISFQRLADAGVIDASRRLTFEEVEALRWLGRTATGQPASAQHRLQTLHRVASGRDASAEPLLACLGEEGWRIIRCAAQDREIFNVLANLSVERLMFVPVTAGESVQKVTFSFESPHFEHLKSDLRAKIRGVFGFTPFNFRFDAPNALLTPSYHFRLRGPDHHYVRVVAQSSVSRLRMRVERNQVLTSIERIQLPASADWVEGLAGTATNYAHIYFRDLYRRHSAPPQILATINERPGGTIGGATFHSLLTLAVGVAVWQLNDVWLDTAVAPQSPRIDAGALLVALPTLAALMLRPPPPESEYVVAPLTSRVAVVISVVCSLMVALLSLATDSYPHSKIPAIVHVLWAVTLALAASSAVWCLFRLLVNAVRFNRLDRSRLGNQHYAN